MVKFFRSFIFVISSLLSTVLYSGESVEDRLSKLECEMRDVCVQNAAGTIGALFASHLQGKSYEWFFDAEVLLWHAKAGGVDWSIVYNQAAYPCKGSMNTLGFGWDWGFRVGVGKYFLHDAWDIGLLYTYFSTQDSSKVNLNFSTSSGTGGSGDLTSPFGSVNGSFSAKFTYNALDLGLGRSYFISKDWMIHPHVGLKNIWLGQKYNFYTDSFINAQNSFLAVSGDLRTAIKDKNAVWGIGPHIGLDNEWNFGCGMQFISAIEGALLQSYFNVVQQQQILVAPIGSEAIDTTIKMKGPMHQFVPYTRLQLGLGWSGDVNDHKQHISCNLTYEANYFWRVNQALNVITSHPSNPSFSSAESVKLQIRRDAEDICFYGITAKIKIEF